MNFIKYVLAVLIPIIFLTVNAENLNGQDLNSSTYFERGEKELKAKNYAEATNAFRIAAQFYLYESLPKKKEIADQLKLVFLDKIRRDSSSFKDEIHTAYLMKGTALANNHNYDEAITQFNIALNYKPDLAEAYLAKGNIYLHNKRYYNEALKMYDLALKYNPTYTSVYVSKGILYADYLGDYNKAIAQYDLAIKYDPNDSTAYSLKALALNKLGKNQESKILNDKAEKLLKK